MSWYDNKITQDFGTNGETGVDIGTPFHTPVTLPYGGTVKSASYQPWGGDVQVQANVPGLGNVLEYLIHLDTIDPAVQPGAQLPTGTFLGYSGGETPAQAANLPGAQHPADPQFSTGPHVEWGFKGANGQPINPDQLLAAVRANGLGAGSGGGNPLQVLAGGASQLAGNVVGDGLKTAGDAFLGAFGVSSAPQFTQRAGLVVMGAVLIIIGLLVLFFANSNATPKGIITQVAGANGANDEPAAPPADLPTHALTPATGPAESPTPRLKRGGKAKTAKAGKTKAVAELAEVAA